MSLEDKIRAAKKYLGERYILHPVNRVIRKPVPQPTVAETIQKAVREQGIDMVAR